MYAQFFGLKHEPFSIAPDPRFLFMSERHREALAHLLYGVRGGGGFVLLSGEIGAGKTTVCRCFLEQIPKRCNVAYIFNPKLTVIELLKSICDEYRIPSATPGSEGATVKHYVDALNEFLLKMHAVGQSNLLIIDEAQNLSADVLEQLRLLTNLETNERKLLQIVLIGQPELRTLLAKPQLEQLAQRVTARYHLEALTEAETTQYIRHRFSVAGRGAAAVPFDRRAMKRIHQLSRGVPRRINLLCDRALLGAYANGESSVDRQVVDRAAAEVFGSSPTGARGGSRAALWGGVGAAAGVALVGVAAFAWMGTREAATPGVPAAAASAPASAAATRTSAAAASAPLSLSAVELAQRFSAPIRDERQAWRELAGGWKLDLAPNDDPCSAAQRQQVQCFRGATNLAQVRQLARPGILTLRDDSDRPVYALLTGLSNDRATLRMGGQSQPVSLVALGKLWRGEFATFWRVPPGYAQRVVDGDDAPLAGWLSAQLARVDGNTAPDEPLRNRIYTFQVAQGLRADGLAGPTTLMQLNRATGVDEPRLATE